VADLRTERFRTAGGIADLAVTAMAVAAMLGYPLAFAADRAQGYLFGRPGTAETLFGPETL